MLATLQGLYQIPADRQASVEQAARFCRRSQLSMLHKAPMRGSKFAKKDVHGASPTPVNNAAKTSRGISPRSYLAKIRAVVSSSKTDGAARRARGGKSITLPPVAEGGALKALEGLCRL